MSHTKPQFDILTRIYEERMKRGWSEYELAARSGLRQSTISTWYRKGLQPSIASLEQICRGFGITLSEFFLDSEEKSAEISDRQQKEIIEAYKKMTPTQQEHLIGLIQSIYQ